MSCSPPRAGATDLGQRAYSTRLALYAAAGLDVADKVRPPDQRFTEAVAQLGRADTRVAAAIKARNVFAGTAEPIVIAVAGAYARALPVLQRREAQQEGRLGALRAAELWCPTGGADFASYARRWIRKRIGQLADRARAVTRPERARLAGEMIEIVSLDPGIRRDSMSCELETLEELAELESRVDRLGRAVAQLPALEREVLSREFERVGPRAAAAASLGLKARDYSATLERALERLRHDLARGPGPAQTELPSG